MERRPRRPQPSHRGARGSQHRRRVRQPQRRRDELRKAAVAALQTDKVELRKVDRPNTQQRHRVEVAQLGAHRRHRQPLAPAAQQRRQRR